MAAIPLRSPREKSWCQMEFTLAVFGSGNVYADARDLIEALFGHEVLRSYLQPHQSETILQPEHIYDGLFGSPKSPRNRHLSAILFKPRIGLWTQCGKDEPWLLIHNPWVKSPLPTGMFPFATELISEFGKLTAIEPTVTLNHVLGLPYPWPDGERSARSSR